MVLIRSFLALQTNDQINEARARLANRYIEIANSKKKAIELAVFDED